MGDLRHKYSGNDNVFCFSCGHSIEYHNFFHSRNSSECFFEECECEKYLDQEVIPQLEDKQE